MSQHNSQSQSTTPLPVKIPVDPSHLQRAITLLGNRTKSDLHTKARQELTRLVGSYPSTEQASIWKSSLKLLLKS